MTVTLPGRPDPPPSPATGRCPSCGGDALDPVIRQERLPIHTSKLLATREEALAYPTGTVQLEACTVCGLLSNTAFAAAAHDYTASYEETQAFSPRFQAYATELAQTLVERHGLRDADILEPGSGRGDFLSLLCAAGGSRGLGIDPSFRDEHAAALAPGVRVERAFFSEASIPERLDAVVCRHTLEHVHDTRGFLEELLRGLAPHPGAVVFVEVPDTLRVLRECAFWDVYYEHCVYFTPGSLARAFRGAGFTVADLALGFDDQYIQLTARTAGDGAPLALEEPPAQTVELARSFARELEQKRDTWRDLLRGLRAEGKRSVVWGAGSKGVGFLAGLGIGEEIDCVVDLNPAKQGMYMPGTGQRIVAPEHLVEVQPDLVAVMNPAYTEEIVQDLQRLGVEARVLAL
jgi:SAM-dependent methyltransferase